MLAHVRISSSPLTHPLCTPYVPLHAPYAPLTRPLPAPYVPLCALTRPLHAPYMPLTCLLHAPDVPLMRPSCAPYMRPLSPLRRPLQRMVRILLECILALCISTLYHR